MHADWLRAFFTREIAIEALAQVGAQPTNKAIELVCATVRRYENRADAKAEATTKRAGAGSGSRLRLELS